MKIILPTLVVPAAIATGFLTGCVAPRDVVERTDPNRPSVVQVNEGYDTFGRKWERFSRNESLFLTYSGAITDINTVEREMTVKSEDGRLATFAVDKSVERFGEARVGDQVSLNYYLGIAAEVRPATDEEKANPLKTLDVTKERSGADAEPSAYDSRRVRSVVTVVSKDEAAQTVTVKDSRGKYYTARVKDRSRLEKTGLNETIVMTFTEATAVSLQPVVETRTEAVLLNYTGTITDIDHANREMTLKTSDGRIDTYYVDKSVQGFDVAKVGDKVSLDYILGISGEVRKPTAEEKQNPLVVLGNEGKTESVSGRAAYEVRQIRALVTIEGLNWKARTVTVKGPRGRYFTTRVADASRLDRVRIGDTVVMTFTEATVVSLKPAAN